MASSHIMWTTTSLTLAALLFLWRLYRATSRMLNLSKSELYHQLLQRRNCGLGLASSRPWPCRCCCDVWQVRWRLFETFSGCKFWCRVPQLQDIDKSLIPPNAQRHLKVLSSLRY
nr:uncharacterized protein LOC112285462 isoform X2 [Physcomitrium patens]|eukprot:XP_024382082.1 uncharacterized protein LOC112285462 isoform X2 [Physcomitrella patens]